MSTILMPFAEQDLDAEWFLGRCRRRWSDVERRVCGDEQFLGGSYAGVTVTLAGAVLAVVGTLTAPKQPINKVGGLAVQAGSG